MHPLSYYNLGNGNWNKVKRKKWRKKCKNLLVTSLSSLIGLREKHLVQDNKSFEVALDRLKFNVLVFFIYLFIYLFVYLFNSLFIYLFICLFVYLLIYLLTYLF